MPKSTAPSEDELLDINSHGFIFRGYLLYLTYSVLEIKIFALYRQCFAPAELNQQFLGKNKQAFEFKLNDLIWH